MRPLPLAVALAFALVLAAPGARAADAVAGAGTGSHASVLVAEPYVTCRGVAAVAFAVNVEDRYATMTVAGRCAGFAVVFGGGTCAIDELRAVRCQAGSMSAYLAPDGAFWYQSPWDSISAQLARTA